jgi:hypothetical protein
MSRNTFWDSFTQVVMHLIFHTTKKKYFSSKQMFCSFSDNSLDFNDTHTGDDNNGGCNGECDFHRSGK